MAASEADRRRLCMQFNEIIFEAACEEFKDEILSGLLQLDVRDVGEKKDIPGSNGDLESYGRIHLSVREESKSGEIDFGAGWSHLETKFISFIVPWRKFGYDFRGLTGEVSSDYARGVLLRNVRREWEELDDEFMLNWKPPTKQEKSSSSGCSMVIFLAGAGILALTTLTHTVT